MISPISVQSQAQEGQLYPEEQTLREKNIRNEIYSQNKKPMLPVSVTLFTYRISIIQPI